MNTRAKPFVSIVTPFYNTVDYLPECIQSVLNQTYTDFEYILVNNCSSDGSDELVRSYAEKDRRIRVITSDVFRDQDQNYNYALQQISPTSTYCKVVQADDWLYPECIAAMVGLAETDPSVGLVSSYSLKGSETQAMIVNDGLPYSSSGVFSGPAVCREQLTESRHYFGSPTSVMYRSEIVRAKDPFYDDVPFPDTVACYDILRRWNLGFVFQVLSFLRQRDESILTNILRFDPLMGLEKLTSVVLGGKSHLSPGEYRRVFKRRSDLYFGFLAREMIRGRHKEFWRYHRDELARIGIELTRRDLWMYGLRELADRALNPKLSVESLLLRRRTK